MACSAPVQTSTAPVVTKDTGAAPVPEPVLEPEVKVPQPEPVAVKNESVNVENDTVGSSQELSVPQDCEGFCAWECERNAHNACNQRERSQCKALCGSTIDPSACSQACSFINQPGACRSQMEKFCKSQCTAKCR